MISLAFAVAGSMLILGAAGETRAADQGLEIRGETHFLNQIYLTGLGRVAQGDPARAVSVFQMVNDVAPELGQSHYSLSVALLLSDYDHRERALSEIKKAQSIDPDHPLYSIVRVMADPALSTMRADGALYLTADGAARLRGATGQLGSLSDSPNARHLAPVLAAVEATKEEAYPYRLGQFGSMIGKDGSVHLAQYGDVQQPFGRLFALMVPATRFNAYEGRMVARIQQANTPVTVDVADAGRKSRLMATSAQAIVSVRN